MPKTGAAQINSAVRSVLAKHWVDMNVLRISSTRGTVRIEGDMRLLPGHHPRQPGAAKMERIQSEIRRIPGVRRVRFMDSSTSA